MLRSSKCTKSASRHNGDCAYLNESQLFIRYEADLVHLEDRNIRENYFLRKK